MAMLKLCRCGKKISAALKMCDQCATSYNKDRHKLYDQHRRDKKAAAFYNSKAWKNVSNMIRARDHYLCQLCLINKRIKTIEVVHHIKELKQHPALSLVDRNLISLCAGCHRKVHVEYEKSNIERNKMEFTLQSLVK